MTTLDEEVLKLARRITVCRLGLAQGGPKELLEVLVPPVINACNDVINKCMDIGPNAPFKPVDEPIGPATTRVLMDAISPVPSATHADGTGCAGERCAWINLPGHGEIF